MSFDLMVFIPEAAPATQAAFMEWYESQTEWKDESAYDDIATAHAKLRLWYADMQKDFPDMNGPDNGEGDELGNEATGYSIATDFIYADFRWSVAEKAFETALDIATKHGIGLFDPQSETIYYPGTTPDNDAPATAQKKPWWKLW